jgi:hypothetical protein
MRPFSRIIFLASEAAFAADEASNPYLSGSSKPASAHENPL